VLVGELERARELFERLLTYTNDLGLLAEQVDPETGQQLGNFPQAFSHMGLINSAIQLQRHAVSPSH
jgi:GH15 family glucan-1,4-alpha-glucosidase